MFGAFRGAHDGATDLYEFMKIELATERPRMIIRHLDANAVPWVSTPIDTVFTLVAAADDCLLFDAIGYRFGGDGDLTVIALIGGKPPRAETLQFERAAQ